MPPPITAGQVVGSYRFVRLLGEGGMGAVYEAVHTTLNRRCAIKTLHAQYAGDPITTARFLQEAKAANRVQHPSVVQIFEFGQFADGTPYFVMEYLEGETLGTRLRKVAQQPAGRMGFPGLMTCWAIAKVCAVVHKQGLIHRDLKPANIMLVDDPDVQGGERIKLLDFGIVKAAPANAEVPAAVADVMTRTGSVMGTPHYMAPEQWRSHKNIDGKVDVYALGVIQFQILTGTLPFDHDDMPILAMQHCFNQAPLLTTLDPSLPQEVEELGMKMLEKDPSKRPTMSEVAGRLGRILGMVSDSEHRPTPLVPAKPVARISKPITPLPAAKPNAEPRTLDPQLLESGDRPPLPLPLPSVVAPPANRLPDWNPEPFLSAAPPTLRKSHRPSGRFVLLVGFGIAVALGGGIFLRTTWRDDGPKTVGALAADLRAIEEPTVTAPPPDLTILPDLATELPPEDLTSSPDLVTRPLPDLASAHLRQPPLKQCVPNFPTEVCIVGKDLTMNQRELIVKAFKNSDAKLCVGERLVLSGLPANPRVATTLPSMERVSGSTRALTLTLRGLLGKGFPAQVEVRCTNP